MLLLHLAATSLQLKAGDIAVGHWRHHLPNNRIIDIVETPEKIVGATPYGLVVFNKSDQSLERINKVHGLSDFGITSLAWSDTHHLMVIGYENGNLDILSNGKVINIRDILQANILGSKTINNILISGNRAFIASGFGIVEFSLDQLLIMDTWFIGPFGSIVTVHDLAIYDNHIYAATNAGLMVAHLQTENLADYRNWDLVIPEGQHAGVFTMLTVHAEQLLAYRISPGGARLFSYHENVWQHAPVSGQSQLRGMRSSRNHLIIARESQLDIYDHNMQLTEQLASYHPGVVTANDALIDATDRLWVADNQFGLVRRQAPMEFQLITLPGPPYANAFGLASGGGRIWVAPGAVSYGGENAWNQNGIFLFEQGKWSGFNRFQFQVMEPVADIIRMSVDPGNPDRVYAASWLGGMLELGPEGPVARYDENNSTLRKRTDHNDRLRIGGTAVDRHGNVWVTNSEVENPLSVRKENGEWRSFSPKGSFNGSQTVVSDLIIDHQGQKWVILPRNGIFVLKENSLENNADYQARRLTTQANNGGLHNINIHSLAVDHNGYIWAGTEEGVAVFYNPGRVFSGEPVNSQRIVVEQADGFAGYLLETEIVTTIKVDGSNKKWFGTNRSGAFLLTEDGRSTIFHFTRQNSPLPSNNILDIAINGETGEVFFATDRGLVSFRGLATEASIRQQSDVYAYPNPVRPGYAGYISVKGLVRNARVKITDINGNLVWETVAEGGQAVWSGQDLFGRRPATGVYLVFSTNEDGEETIVTKIMFIH